MTPENIYKQMHLNLLGKYCAIIAVHARLNDVLCNTRENRVLSENAKTNKS